MANYVDGFVLPIPKKNIKAYLKMAKLCGKVWLEYGALEYYECMGDDTPVGKITSFPRSVKLKKNEVAFFSWIVYKSRAHRDRVLAKVMSDPRLQSTMPPNSPFDSKRMIYGGFKTQISLKSKK